MTETFDIQGMTCSACSTHVQRAAASVEGVEEANVNLLKNSMELTYDGSASTAQAVVRAIEDAGYGATRRAGAAGASAVPGKSQMAAAREATEANAQRDIDERFHQLVASAVLSVPLFYVAMGEMFGWPMPGVISGMEGMLTNAIVQLLLAGPILFINRRYFVNGFKNLLHLSPNMDSLVAMGSAASAVYSVATLLQMSYWAGLGETATVHTLAHNLYFDSAGIILTLVTLGKYFEARAKGQTTSAINDLMDLAPKTATVERDGVEVTVPTEEVAVGDVVVVRAGESVPVDGVVIEGTALVDESAITGESVPVEKSPGSRLTGATVQTRGWLRMRATAVGDDTTLAGIVRLVDEATSSKAPIERMADKIAGVFVPVVIAIAALTFVVWMVIGDFSDALNHAISVLVISCPCALGLATPTAIMVGTGRGAAYGILIKSAEALETACKVDVVVLDKTGTVTEGSPRVTDVELAPGVRAAELVRAAAAVERKSEHPLAQAVCAYADETLPGSDEGTQVEGFEQVAGGGLAATVDGHEVLAGNARLMAARGVGLGALEASAAALADDAKTALFFAVDGRALGLLGVADAVKPTSAGAVASLRAMGVRTVLLTGDQRRTAEAVARQVGVDEVVAGVLPDQKERRVRTLQEEGHCVAMVGDGINDAPALARADVGIAIGAGTDIAIDSADVVLMHSDPADVACAIELSRATMRNIKQNLFWALFYNSIFIPVAAGVLVGVGITLNPMICAATMGCSSLFVVGNALRLRRWKPTAGEKGAGAGTTAAAVTVRVEDASEEKTGQAVGQAANEAEGAGAPAEGEETVKRTLKVEGMMCEHCVMHVTKALEGVKGVRSVSVSLEKGTAEVEVGLLTSNDALVAAVEEAGYSATVA